MRHVASLYLFLFVVWLLWSGVFTAPLILLGLGSCAFVVWLALRKEVVDRESVPLHLRFGNWLRFCAWLSWQIVKSNIDVTRRILDPRLPISPTRVRLPAELSDLGRVIYANSITLTPGTVAIDVDKNTIEVHSLTREAAIELEQGEMYRRVKQLEPTE